MSNPMFDLDFLVKLMNYQHREVHARITLLTQNELPLQQIEGKVTSGSINVDGNSALRRTCNLSLVLKDKTEINKFYWAFKQKFKLEIGLSNVIDEKYPEVIWFKQGIFVITSHDMNQSINNYTITINGKDKMCLLNGDLSGTLSSSVDFGTIEYHDLDTDTITKTQVPLKDIIYEAIHNYGGELSQNIIVNDLDELGLELLEYRNDKGPLFGLRDISTNEVFQMTLDENQQLYIENETTPTPISSERIVYATTSSLINSSVDPTRVRMSTSSDEYYHILKFEYGDLAGYRTTDLVYAGELVGNIGESLTSILDKIKNMLDEFEYFYNIDGKFVFQKKRKYISTPWNSTEQSSEELKLHLSDSLPVVKLTDNKLVTAFTNRPNLANVKNDYCVWGTHKGISGAVIPIHMRYAIDVKPVEYRPIRPMKQTKQIDGETKVIFEDKEYFGKIDSVGVVDGEITSYYATDTLQSEGWDWRELIYQMALDYRKCQKDNDFLYNLADKNPLYSTGRTGYEQYYTDMEGFWRTLYDPKPDPEFIGIETSEINEDNKNSIYINRPHRPLTQKEYDEKLFDPEELFVLDTIQTSDGEKETFYPFIGSSKCCLYADDQGSSPYYYLSGNTYHLSSDKKVLNAKNIRKIYLDATGTSLIQSRYNSIGASNLWVRDSGKKSLSDIPEKCKVVYGIDMENNVYPDAFHNWNIIDNYGTKATDRETTYKIEYLAVEVNYNNNPATGDYWHKNVSDDPSQLIFWFDFLEAGNADVSKYSVQEIGPRTKFLNDSNVKYIYYKETPEVIFVSNLSEEGPSGFTKIQLPPYYEGLFSISAKGKSAKERIDELLYVHSYSIESTSINTIPIYYLEPNTRVLVKDESSNIDGEYLVSRITIPLTYNGTMNLTATKVNPNF